MNNTNTLGIIEFSTVSSGYKYANEIVKNVQIKNLKSYIVQPHKLVLFLEDNYQNIQYAMEYAIEISSNSILDLSIIGNIDHQVYEYLNDPQISTSDNIHYLGLFSVNSISEGITLSNELILNYQLNLLKLDFNNYMHGKCLVIVEGNISPIQDAIQTLHTGELLTMPDKDILHSILGG